ncbi:MAG: adenylate/guanylate cyclase domain-containing protein [Chitinophagales bacterium]
MEIDTLIAQGLNSIGYLKTNSGHYQEAITYLFDALQIFESLEKDKSTIICLQYIAIAYIQQGMFETATSYATRAMELAQATNNLYSVSVSMTTLGSIYYSEGDLDKALDFFQMALEVVEELNDKQGIADALNNVAVILEEKKEFDKAITYHHRSLDMAKELNDTRGIAASYHNIGLVYKSMGNFEKAITYIDSCMSIAKDMLDKFYIKESYNGLAESYALMGKYDLAYQNVLLFSQYRDSLLNEESQRQFAEMSTKYESEKKEQQIVIQKTQIEKEKLLRNSFIGGFAVVLVFAGIFFTQRNKIKKGKKLSDELLLNILPEEVAEELKTKGNADAKQFEQVTVMFTDFKDFTLISEQLSPAELVAQIDTFFKTFDNIISRYGIEKIKTIGDCYMCAGGLPVPNKTNAMDVVKAAFEIQDFIKQNAIQNKSMGKDVFEIRIGIHTGSVVAGIVGVKKFAYDIWGDTVNIASRMESSGEVGKVNISSSTYDLVKDKFKCTYRGKVLAKNKGEIDMYFVEGEFA